MKWLRTFFVFFVLCTSLFAADWPSTGGNAQRDGWARAGDKLSKETAASIRFLYAFKLNHGGDLTSPVVLSNLITYKGFKQLVFFGEGSNSVAAIDADLGTLFFDTQLTTEEVKAQSAVCPGGMTASVAFAGNSLAPGRFGAPAANHAGRVSRTKPGPRPRFSISAPVYAITDDGSLHTILELSGNATTKPPLKAIPVMARATGLNVDAGRVFVATVGNCGGNPNQLYSIDTSDNTVASFATGGSGASGSGGTAIGTDGVVYAQVASGHSEGIGDFHDSVLALSPDKLKLQDYFTPEDGPAKVDSADLSGVTPAVFGLQDKDWIVSGGHDGRIYILDADSLGGADHHTPAFRSSEILPPSSSGKGNGFWNNFATSLDAKGVRWLYASVRGPVSAEFPATNGDAATGSILAFKITFESGKPSLTPAWRSRDMISPAAPAVSNGLVFALSTGQPASFVRANGKPYKVRQWNKMGRPAVLYVLDAETGKELFAGNKATTFATSGLAVANSQIYFATHENGLYAYGIPIER